jgi:hypothetical protein
VKEGSPEFELVFEWGEEEEVPLRSVRTADGGSNDGIDDDDDDEGCCDALLLFVSSMRVVEDVEDAEEDDDDDEDEEEDATELELDWGPPGGEEWRPKAPLLYVEWDSRAPSSRRRSWSVSLIR